MTHTVDPIRFKYKKTFKQAIKDGENVYLTDPSTIFSLSGTIGEILDEREEITVTNHPKRSWFARIRRSKRTGRIIVE